MKPEMSAGDGRAVVATIEATSTCADGPNQMPLGFARTTRPFEVSEPKICDGLAPITSLSEIELALGCWMLTVSPRPIEKLCHVIAERFVVSMIERVVGEVCRICA